MEWFGEIRSFEQLADKLEVFGYCLHQIVYKCCQIEIYYTPSVFIEEAILFPDIETFPNGSTWEDMYKHFVEKSMVLN